MIRYLYGGIMLNTGIYQIKNTKNGMIYIGSTNNFEKRKKQHFSELRAKRHINTKLQADFNTYNESSFEWKIIEYTWKSKRLEREQFWINKYKKLGKCYNTGTANVNQKTLKNELLKIWNQIKRSIIESLF